MSTCKYSKVLKGTFVLGAKRQVTPQKKYMFVINHLAMVQVEMNNKKRVF